MNPIESNPPNMSRVIVLSNGGIFSFAFYKDGMYQMEGSSEKWLHPFNFKSWLSISELKNKLL